MHVLSHDSASDPSTNKNISELLNESIKAALDPAATGAPIPFFLPQQTSSTLHLQLTSDSLLVRGTLSSDPDSNAALSAVTNDFPNY